MLRKAQFSTLVINWTLAQRFPECSLRDSPVNKCFCGQFIRTLLQGGALGGNNLKWPDKIASWEMDLNTLLLFLYPSCNRNWIVWVNGNLQWDNRHGVLSAGLATQVPSRRHVDALSSSRSRRAPARPRSGNIKEACAQTRDTSDYLSIRSERRDSCLPGETHDWDVLRKHAVKSNTVSVSLKPTSTGCKQQWQTPLP